ncbi:hypothetical protein MHYP_G00087840, partial [Metynnis hypsauchen]
KRKRARTPGQLTRGSNRPVRAVRLSELLRGSRQEAVMTVEATGPAGPAGPAGPPGPAGLAVRSYRDATLANLPPDFHSKTPVDPLVLKLIISLRDLLARYPSGVSLMKARRSCPLLLHPRILNNHPSVRHLLASMPSVVQLQGVGVQTRIFSPVS